jgi:hypothetical protein
MNVRVPIATALLVLSFAGCKTKPIYPGPNYSLGDLPNGAPQQPVALEVVDARPWWERRYYDGYFKLVPLENLRPSPLPFLAEEMQQQASALPDRPERIKLMIDSFRVVWYDAAEEEKEKTKTFVLTEDYEADDFRELVGAIAAEGIAQAAYRSLLLCRDGMIEWGQKERHLHGPPRHVKEKYPEGLSCDLRVSAELEWSDGRRRTVQTRALVNAAAMQDDQSDELRNTVLAACTQVAHSWAEKAKNQKSIEEDPPKPPAQFTAFGGD